MLVREQEVTSVLRTDRITRGRARLTAHQTRIPMAM